MNDLTLFANDAVFLAGADESIGAGYPKIPGVI
jgi:hypothetical protein